MVEFTVYCFKSFHGGSHSVGSNIVFGARKERNLSQIALSQKLGMSDSFISHVESTSRRAKYNLNHLNAIAQILQCSPKDFWPDKPIMD